MDEILKKLLEAEVLSPETKKEMEKAFTEFKEDAQAEIRAELTEKWEDERTMLIEAIDSKLTEYLTHELKELSEDISKYKDLEADYAVKLVEAKSDMAKEFKRDLKKLVETISEFLEVRVKHELVELKEDINEVKKIQFGKKLYQSFLEEFKTNFGGDEFGASRIRDLETKLNAASDELVVTKNKLVESERNLKLTDLLKPLTGSQREAMSAILKNVETDRLDEAYKRYIGKIIKNSSDKRVSGNEGTVITENSNVMSKVSEGKKILVTGDRVPIKESLDEFSNSTLSEESREYLRTLSNL